MGTIYKKEIERDFEKKARDQGIPRKHRDAFKKRYVEEHLKTGGLFGGNRITDFERDRMKEDIEDESSKDNIPNKYTDKMQKIMDDMSKD